MSVRRRSLPDVAGVEITFTESEVAEIIWVLLDSADLAERNDALASLAMLEDALRLVRHRFDQRRPPEL